MSMAVVAVERTFDVGVPLEEAWRRLAEVERWPEWAPHITSVTVSPSGPLGPGSSGALHIKRFGRNTFRMTAWDPPARWEWVGGVPGLGIRYDHRFTAAGPTRTRLDWTVELGGPLARISKPVFTRIYGRNVDRAIPRLQAWITRGGA